MNEYIKDILCILYIIHTCAPHVCVCLCLGKGIIPIYLCY